MQAHKSAVQELTSQLSESTSVTKRQKAELFIKEVLVQRLDGELSQQQTKVGQLQSLVSKTRSEVQRLTAKLAEKQSEVEGKQAVIENLGSRLTASIEEVSTVHKEMAGAQHTYNTDAQVCNIHACFWAPLLQLLVCSTSCCNHANTVLEPELWHL
jgi:chromosome segregation ATPase